MYEKPLDFFGRFIYIMITSFQMKSTEVYSPTHSSILFNQMLLRMRYIQVSFHIFYWNLKSSAHFSFFFFFSDKSMVVCAPTGSGKTVVFEMAIVQLLMELEDKNYTDDFKIIYSNLKNS